MRHRQRVAAWGSNLSHLALNGHFCLSLGSPKEPRCSHELCHSSNKEWLVPVRRSRRLRIRSHEHNVQDPRVLSLSPSIPPTPVPPVSLPRAPRAACHVAVCMQATHDGAAQPLQSSRPQPRVPSLST